MASELQRLTDALGHSLKRNVSVDDPTMHQIAFSSHVYEPIDLLRQRTILRKDLPPEVAAWLRAAGAFNTRGPLRPPLDEGIGGTEQRLCLPIRRNGLLVGYLWILEGRTALSDDELATALGAADSLAVVMQREQQAADLYRAQVRELATELIFAANASARSCAAEKLLEAELFVPNEPLFVLVVSLHAGRRAMSDEERGALEGRLDGTGRRLSERRYLSLARRDHGLLVLSDRDPLISGGARDRLCQDLLADLVRDLPGTTPLIGIGEVVDDLADAYRSHRDAERAGRVARLVDGLGTIVRADQLGVYGLLARIPDGELSAASLPRGLLTLLSSGAKGRQLVDTLEAYLENAGDGPATAEQLYVHRTTLYYRLQRIEELTGAQLSKGEDRLAFHLGLKIATLLGLRSASVDEGSAARQAP
ncbi:helix-turn-helix domain-containing protein [Nonomuraea sp. NPDC047529]|uniref:PucR family transcriptional regulator n=1 Tax=Nonomuraea sp. NPDC047529 TaxID=3155623 RepID=UPI0033C71C59